MAILDPKKQAHQADLLTGYTSEYLQISERAKAMAKARRDLSPVTMDKMPKLIQAFSDYAEDCQARHVPMTWAGFAMAGNISGTTLDRMREGRLDHVVEEYRIINDIPPDAEAWVNDDGEIIPLIPLSSIVEKCCALPIMAQLESNCYQLKGNQVGSIFGLRARFGWQDEAGHTTTNNTLIVADKDKALSVLDMLKPSDTNV